MAGSATAAITRPPPSSTVPAPTCPERILAAMTDAQRIGQLFMVGVPLSTPDQQPLQVLRDMHAGGVVLYGNTHSGAAAVRVLDDRIRAMAAASAAGVGPYVATDQEGGEIQELAGPGFDVIPPATTQGNTDPATLAQQARVWAGELARAGVNVDLAPVLDVVPAAFSATNQPIGHYHRQLGSDPVSVGAHGAAIVRSLQGSGVGATVKHFPGLGRVLGNTDTTAGVVDTVTTRHDSFLTSFAAGIRAGARFALISLATYRQIDPAHRAVFSSIVIRDMLRGDLGFRGLVLSDDLGSAAQVSDLAPGQRAIEFLEAGGNVVVAVKPSGVVAPMVAAVAAAESRPEFRRTVDADALAVLEAKASAGLLPCP